MAGENYPKTYFAGIDLGGTGTKLGLVDRAAPGVEGFMEIATLAHRPRCQVVSDITAAVAELTRTTQASGNRIAGLGIGVPAALSREGRIEVLPNFAPGWVGVDLAQELCSLTGLPTTVLNDARAFTLAEATSGAAAGADSALGVTLGTGVGGGLILNGRLYLGSSGKAGELGHHVVEPNGVRCGCGSHGCLETVASATALVASVTRSFLQGASPILRELTGSRHELLTPAVIGRAAASGDVVCQEAIERAAYYLGIAIANVATLTGIETVVIGGGMAGLGDILLDPLRAALAAHAPVLGDDLPQVRAALLGERAGVIGAALQASTEHSSS